MVESASADFELQRLDRNHEVAEFTCGNPELNEWLRLHAADATGHGTRTYVLVDRRSNTVAGFFALAPHLLERAQAPKPIARGAPQRIPAILLAKLAVSTQVQGQGLGTDLLVQALETIVVAAKQAGGRLIVVDAIDSRAAAFYAHHDFLPTPNDPLRLVLKISTAAKALEIPWP